MPSIQVEPLHAAMTSGGNPRITVINGTSVQLKDASAPLLGYGNFGDLSTLEGEGTDYRDFRITINFTLYWVPFGNSNQRPYPTQITFGGPVVSISATPGFVDKAPGQVGFSTHKDYILTPDLSITHVDVTATVQPPFDSTHLIQAFGPVYSYDFGHPRWPAASVNTPIPAELGFGKTKAVSSVAAGIGGTVVRLGTAMTFTPGTQTGRFKGRRG